MMIYGRGVPTEVVSIFSRSCSEEVFLIESVLNNQRIWRIINGSFQLISLSLNTLLHPIYIPSGFYQLTQFEDDKVVTVINAKIVINVKYTTRHSLKFLPAKNVDFLIRF